MAEPVRIEDRPAYRGDPYSMRFIFTNRDGSRKDVAGASWEIKSALPFEVDDTHAANGEVWFTVQAQYTGDTNIPSLVRWDLAEKNIWKRTIFAGRLVMQDQVVE